MQKLLAPFTDNHYRFNDDGREQDFVYVNYFTGFLLNSSLVFKCLSQTKTCVWIMNVKKHLYISFCIG